MLKRFTILFSAIMFCSNILSGQTTTIPSYQGIGDPYLQHFTAQDYEASSQNWKIIQDQRGLMYFGNTAGILEYDGVNWRRINTPLGSVIRALAIDDRGIIYAGGQGEIGYLAPDSLGQLTFVSLNEWIPEEYRDFADVQYVNITENGIVFNPLKYLFRWQFEDAEPSLSSQRPAKGKMTVFSPKENESFHNSQVFNDKLYIHFPYIGLHVLEKDSFQLIPDGAFWARKALRFIYPLEDNPSGFIIGSGFQGVYIHDGSTFQALDRDPALAAFLSDKTLFGSCKLPDGKFAIGTLSGEMGIINEQGDLLRIVDKNSGLQDVFVLDAQTDREGGLWLALGNGISRMELPGPFTRFQKAHGIEGTMMTVLRHQGNLYGGGAEGLFKWSDVGDSKTTPLFVKVDGIENQTWDLLSTPEGLLIANHFGIYILKNNRVDTIFEQRSTTPFKLLASSHHPNLVFAALNNGLSILQRVSGNWIYSGRIKDVNENINTIVEENATTFWAGTRYQGYLKIKLESNLLEALNKGIEIKDSALIAELNTFGPSAGVPSSTAKVFTIGGNPVFATQAGLRRFDSDQGVFVPYNSFGEELADTTRAITLLQEDSDQSILVFSGKGQPRAGYLQRGSDGNFKLDETAFRRLQGIREMHRFYQDPANPSIIWIPGNDGLIRYDRSIQKDYTVPFQAQIRKVIATQDSTLFLGYANSPTWESISLKYAENALRFEYAAPSYDELKANEYQVILEGFDKEWSNWTQETQKDYTNLPEGTYRFRVRARNLYGTESQEDVFTFKVLPPFYRTWWAYLIYGLLGIGLIYGIVQWRSRQLKQRNLELEAIVKDRTREVSEQAEKLKELDKAKTHFFTNISHEFRTPLTVIQGMAGQIEEDPDKWAKKGTSLIKRNSGNLLNLVNQILDLRKLESDKLKLQLVQADIIRHLKYIIESFHSFAEGKDIALNFSPHSEKLMMDFDPEKIIRVMSNLLSNAIKFTEKGGQVEIHTSIESQNGNSEMSSENLVLIVKDSGVGIQPEKLPHIFDRFYQIDDPAVRHEGGTGIGLSLVRELVQLMKGTITVESEVGKGTAFAIALPISRNEKLSENIANPDIIKYQGDKNGETIATALVKATTENAPSLLIIEDNPDVVEYLKACLEDSYELLIANDGEEGIEVAQNLIPDLIISDVMMPKKDGYEVCNTLKTDERTSHIPIILLTAKADHDSKMTGLKVGADAYLAKPFDKEELFIRLKKLHQLRLQLQARYSSLESTAQTSSEPQAQIEDAFIQKLRSLIESQIDDPDLSIQKVSKELFMSRAHLHRKVSALTGQSPSVFIRRIRLHKAKEMLENGELNVTQIAYEVGFKNPSYFTTSFKEEFGVAPREVFKG